MFEISKFSILLVTFYLNNGFCDTLVVKAFLN